MKRIVIREHSRIVRLRKGDSTAQTDGCTHLESHLYDRLKRFDHYKRAEADRIFRWSDSYALTRQWVGVVQVPGLQLEILPKIDVPEVDQEQTVNQAARANLLYMLSISGDIPVRSRDLASLLQRRAPLSETLARLFAESLKIELLRGPERSYVQFEENVRSFKGKLLSAKQSLHNAAHRERFYCRFEEFCDDTIMNRIFRATCRYLLSCSYTPATQDVLSHCVLLLESVQDVFVHDELFDQVVLSRQNERFADLLNFCRHVLRDFSPTAQTGDVQTFSVLFDMNYVFERFIAGFLRSRVLDRFPGYSLYASSKKKVLHLMSCNGQGIFPLQPDLVIEAEDGERLLLDTKWKRLSNQGNRGGVSTSDLYQLFAYTRRYGCKRSLLLYPQVPGSKQRDFEIIDSNNRHSGEQVGIRFVDIHRNLRTSYGRDQLADELARVIEHSFEGIRATGTQSQCEVIA
jgi:5-methylcytosine-specific restriction enzyme subunit McrC